MTTSKNFIDHVAAKTARVGVVGLGYVGLPLAREFRQAGFKVIGFDHDDSKIKTLKAGRSYIHHISPSVVKEMNANNGFKVSSKIADLKKAQAILLCVPTPLDKNLDPDLSYVENACRELSSILQPGQVIILESTTYPGTTREVMVPLLEESGLKEGKDFYVAYSPEREDPGNPQFNTASIPKVVGACSAQGLKCARALYDAVVVETIAVSSPEVAEATKILENIYRCINIALVNELKMLFDRMDIDVHEVIAAASTKPFGFQPFYPGPGLGGHCIPIDPFYLSYRARRFNMPTRFIELAGEINRGMPGWVITKVMEGLNERGLALKKAKILILGMAYKKNVDDCRESPAIELIKLLQERGAQIQYHDPYVPHFKGSRHLKLKARSQPLTSQTLKKTDCVVIATAHDEVDYDLVVEHASLIVDTRNAIPGAHKLKHVIKA